MNIIIKLLEDPWGKEVEQTLYWSMIGNLLYLIASQIDISFSVGICVRFKASPKESNLATIKQIIKYINGTLEFGICYALDTTTELIVYFDAR